MHITCRVAPNGPSNFSRGILISNDMLIVVGDSRFCFGRHASKSSWYPVLGRSGALQILSPVPWTTPPADTDHDR